MSTELTEGAVRDRYADAAQTKEESFCCAVDYDARYLEMIPGEVIERDYGCDDTSRYLRKGETVLAVAPGRFASSPRRLWDQKAASSAWI